MLRLKTISPSLRLEISGLKQRLKQAEADKKRLELKVTTKKEQLIEARDKLNARDRYLYCNIKKYRYWYLL